MMLRLLSATLALSAATALDNGVGRTPMMGWSSWYATPGGSNVTSAFVRATAQVMLSSGLAAKGYSLVAVDEGWLQGRYPNGTIYEDLSKFPEGMAGLGAWVTGQGFRYGLYTCRGTCQVSRLCCSVSPSLCSLLSALSCKRPLTAAYTLPCTRTLTTTTAVLHGVVPGPRQPRLRAG